MKLLFKSPPFKNSSFKDLNFSFVKVLEEFFELLNKSMYTNNNIQQARFLSFDLTESRVPPSVNFCDEHVNGPNSVSF